MNSIEYRDGLDTLIKHHKEHHEEEDKVAEVIANLMKERNRLCDDLEEARKVIEEASHIADMDAFWVSPELLQQHAKIWLRLHSEGVV